MRRFLVVAIMALVSVCAYSQRTLIHCGRLLDGKTRALQSEMTIVIEGKIIVAIEKGFTIANTGDDLIDLANKTVLPGLIDLHVHIESETNKDQALERFTLNEADIAFRSAQYAHRTLMAGFTTVRDLGGTGVNIALRNAINQGIAIGPRIFTAGKSLASTGGHADPTNGYRKDLMGDPGPTEGVINSPDDAREAVRQRYKDGADLIKITATGGVLSIAKDGSGPQFNEAELTAVIETARDYGMQVAAHAHGAEGMKRAVNAGVTTIEHGTKMTEEIMDLMKQKGTFFVPTITAGKFVAEQAKVPGYYHPAVVPKALEIGPMIQQTFRKAFKRGVRIAFGTDAGVFPHGQNAKEFGYMVEAGMPAIDAILSATTINAGILGMSDKLGTVQRGNFADIIAVDGNPLEDIHVLEQVSFVMKDGVVYKQ
jgi:imidazolonepropionase-like amidohydrolase